MACLEDELRLKLFARFLISNILLTTAFISLANANNDERWFLMSRHGECMEIKSLQRKIPDIDDVKDPKTFSTFMERKGYKVITNQQNEVKGKVFFVNVPEIELYLIFAMESICKEFIQK